MSLPIRSRKHQQKHESKDRLLSRLLSKEIKKIHCIACATSIHITAKICPECLTDQRTKQRRLKKTIAAFSGVSVVLGVITIAVSLFPNAYKLINPKLDFDIYSVDASFVSKLEILEMTMFNKGNVDVFVSKVIFKAIDKDKYPINDRLFITNKWVKGNEAFVYSGSPTTARNLLEDWMHVQGGWFDKISKARGFKENQECFKIVTLDKDIGDTGQTPLPHFIPIEAFIYYSSKDSTKVSIKKSRKNLGGQIFQKTTGDCRVWFESLKTVDKTKIGTKIKVKRKKP